MGGSLTVHSDGPGRGATFVLELPQNTPPTDTNFRKQTRRETTNPVQENAHEHQT